MLTSRFANNGNASQPTSVNFEVYYYINQRDLQVV